MCVLVFVCTNVHACARTGLAFAVAGGGGGGDGGAYMFPFKALRTAAAMSSAHGQSTRDCCDSSVLPEMAQGHTDSSRCFRGAATLMPAELGICNRDKSKEKYTMEK